MFFPTRGTLAYSDHLLGPAFQLFLFLKVIPNAVAGYNFLFLSSYVASALAVCWVLRRSGLSWIAAALAGWMYAYSSFRLAQFPHLQILLAQWIPLTLWFWDRLLARRTAKDAALFLLFYLLNLTGGCYLAYMIHFPMLAILASRALSERRELLSFRFLRLLLPVGLVAGVAAAALFLPYVRVAREQRLARPESEIETYSARLASYFSPSNQNFYFGDRADDLLERAFGDSAELFHRPENELFAGFLPTILFFVGAWSGLRRRGPADPWVRGSSCPACSASRSPSPASTCRSPRSSPAFPECGSRRASTPSSRWPWSSSPAAASTPCWGASPARGRGRRWPRPSPSSSPSSSAPGGSSGGRCRARRSCRAPIPGSGTSPA
jgi:hypothetical protein